MFYRVHCVKTGQRFGFFSRELLEPGQRVAFVADDGGNFVIEVEQASEASHANTSGSLAGTADVGTSANVG